MAVSGGGCAAGRLATCPTEPSFDDEPEIPLIDVLADMEFTGIRLDVQFLNNLAVDMERQLADIESATTSGGARSSTSPRSSSCGRCCSRNKT